MFVNSKYVWGISKNVCIIWKNVRNLKFCSHFSKSLEFRNLFTFYKKCEVSKFCSWFPNIVCHLKFCLCFKKCSEFQNLFMFLKSVHNFFFSFFKTCSHFQKMFKISKFSSGWKNCSHFPKYLEFWNLFTFSKKVKVSKFCSCLSKNCSQFQNLFAFS